MFKGVMEASRSFVVTTDLSMDIVDEYQMF